jgi:glyoxylase-like metal-dependent hydrolase (beta-lactamase superfamily II)/rhodanese-related sulfurtransferase
MALLFRQLFDVTSSTWTYLLADPATREAILIDPVFERFTRDAALIGELDLALRYTLETHVHADHVTAAWLFKEQLGSRIIAAKAGGAQGIDVPVAAGDTIRFGEQALIVRATPGHTAGCLTYVEKDQRIAFTGDALLIRSAGRTDFQGGDPHTLYRSVREQIFTLPGECLLYPGHDYQGRAVTSVLEERRHNPRLGGTRSEDDFVGVMKNLGLPHPRQMEQAVPANLRCGRPEKDLELPRRDDGWAPVRSFAGVAQVEPEWLEEHLGEVTILDVREPEEFTGELGHIDGAVLVPLGQLRARVAEVSRERPIVSVCRSGGRSAQACSILEGTGLERVANLSGGMLKWRALGLHTRKSD